ncbi:mechanosensitive ion channel family protein [Spirosoma soli]|uniref:Mechanosensitive ion channel family protein n=1 Tax=Spirosoma soli TaxID=1770529 RepID=A0ABW5M805_9BACT
MMFQQYNNLSISYQPVKKLFVKLALIILFLTGAKPVMAQDTTKSTGNPPALTIPDTLLFKIQKAQSVITEIKAANKKNSGANRIRNGLRSIKASIAPISADVNTPNKSIDSKNLSSYGLILDDSQEKLTDWRATLSKANNDLQSRLDEVLALSDDSLLIVAGNDTTQKKFYAGQLSSLKLQLQEAGTLTSAKLDSVSRLLADVSATSISVSNLQAIINEQLQKSNTNAFYRESPYLWDAPTSFGAGNTQAIVKSTYQGQNKIFRYFINSTWDNRLLLLLLSGLFFVWVFTNYRKAAELLADKQIDPIRFENLKPVPIVASLIVYLNLTPLFEPTSPSLYIEVTQFLLLMVLTVHLWKRFTRHDLRFWLLNIAMYVALIVVNALLNDSIFIRLALIALNIGFLYIGLVFYPKLNREHISQGLINPVIRLYQLLQVLAIVLNVFGRISLAKTLGITAVIGLVQVIGLGVFIQIMMEGLELQMRLSTHAKGIFSRVNTDHIRGSFQRILLFVTISLWLLVFFINLGIANSLFNFFYQILVRPRSFGSITFTLSNVLSFSIIVYLSSLLQKNVSLLFGESKLPSTGEQVEHISSMLALVRLVIIIAGVLLAVAASGISVDKLTVVLGALSVGIGLGMQNIVSNFVSGIILIFEKPFQIGDYIELADKKGMIHDIGIRSSRMKTVQGSEVIIPNSDLLANRLVNWTSNSSNLKTDLTFKVGADTNLPALTDLIKKEVVEIQGVVKTIPPEVLVTAIAADSIELKVQVWITSVYTEASFKSQLLQQLLKLFSESGIKVV